MKQHCQQHCSRHTGIIDIRPPDSLRPTISKPCCHQQFMTSHPAHSLCALVAAAALSGSPVARVVPLPFLGVGLAHVGVLAVAGALTEVVTAVLTACVPAPGHAAAEWEGRGVTRVEAGDSARSSLRACVSAAPGDVAERPLLFPLIHLGQISASSSSSQSELWQSKRSPLLPRWPLACARARCSALASLAEEEGGARWVPPPAPPPPRPAACFFAFFAGGATCVHRQESGSAGLGGEALSKGCRFFGGEREALRAAWLGRTD